MSLVDISYTIKNGMPKYPSDPDAIVNVIKATSKHKINPLMDESGCSSGAGMLYTAYQSGYANLNLRNHHGTHLDAPAHKLPYGRTLDHYPLAKFTNSVGIVDLSRARVYTRAKSEIGVNDIKAFLQGLPIDVGALLFYTGFIDHINTQVGLVESEKTTANQFPFFSEQAMIEILAFFPKLNIIGLDSFSFDPRGSNSDIHRLMFKDDILPLETICNLRGLKQAQQNHTKRTLHCAPLLLENCDAAQTRAYVEFA
jgi:kynurenine formamidase